MHINKETLHKIAHLARLQLKPEDEVSLKKDLEQIVSWVEKLEELDLSAYESGHATEVRPLDSAREDKPGKTLTHEEALKNAPEKEDGFFVVPNIMKSKGA